MNFVEKIFKAKESENWSEVKKDLIECKNINETYTAFGGWRLRSLIQLSAPVDTLKIALEQGADPNFHIDNSNLPSLFYIDGIQIDSIQLLIKYGANVNFQVANGQTVFTLKPYRKIEFYKTIGENEYDFSLLDNQDNNILHYAMHLINWDSSLAEYVLSLIHI